ncbi:MAG: DUF4234 domain-containing protein [Actinobacteria bacterium]|nr:MAG: DUF4234 domain-containing protein [Actinomycetota bacterium]
MSREEAGEMADELQIGTGSIKRRNPWGVLLLAIVTLGIYRLVWYYMINREIRDHSGEQVPVEAVTIGWIIIVPPFVSLYRTAGRIRRVQEITGARKRISPGLALLLAIVSWTMLIDMPYLQTHINSAWDVEFERVKV